MQQLQISHHRSWWTLGTLYPNCWKSSNEEKHDKVLDFEVPYGWTKPQRTEVTAPVKLSVLSPVWPRISKSSWTITFDPDQTRGTYTNCICRRLSLKILAIKKTAKSMVNHDVPHETLSYVIFPTMKPVIFRLFTRPCSPQTPRHQVRRRWWSICWSAGQMCVSGLFLGLDGFLAGTGTCLNWNCKYLLGLKHG